MAEVFGLVAGVVQVAGFAGSLVKTINSFVQDALSLPDSIRGLHNSIDSLHVVLKDIEATFKKRPGQRSFEQNHHASIDRILKSCRETLVSLDKELPVLKDKNTIARRMVVTLEQQIKAPRVQELLSRIASYTTVLQLSLITLSLGALWGTQSSQQRIEAELCKLSDSMRSAGLFLQSSTSESTVRSGHGPDTHQSGDETELGDDFVQVDGTMSVLDEEIQDWRTSADDVATAVLSKNIDDNSSAHSINPESSVSVHILPEYEKYEFDPEPEHPNIPSRDILEFQLKANQDYVNMFRSWGFFRIASTYQRRGIKMQEALEQIHDVPCSFDQVADMEEALISILLESETDEGISEAESILQQLLEKEIARPDGEQDMLRTFRLYHTLGELIFKQGFTLDAKKFLERAFEGRKAVANCPPNLLRESAESLVKLLQTMQEFDRARGIQEWMQSNLPEPPSSSKRSSVEDGGSEASSTSIDAKLGNVLRWCRRQGLNVELISSFGFGITYEDGKTPIHCVIEDEEVEVLRDMLEVNQRSNLTDQRDSKTLSTPLHLAAAKRNKHLVSLLLDRGASPSELDKDGMSPLHRCQSASGGTKVAELLLNHCPDELDKTDSLGKTPLYMACERGNAKMARLLLECRACPNIQGPGQCTPLIRAIEMASRSTGKIAIVKLLLQYGADPTKADAYGRNAFDVAKNAGLAGSEIRRLLSTVPPLTPTARYRAFSTTATISGRSMSRTMSETNST